jgi:hypothetical protein
MAVCPGRWAGLGPELCAASLCGAASVGTVRYTVVVRDVVHDLLITEAGLAKLGGRGISAEEAGQIPRNPHVIVRNRAVAAGGRTPPTSGGTPNRSPARRRRDGQKHSRGQSRRVGSRSRERAWVTVKADLRSALFLPRAHLAVCAAEPFLV